MRANSQLLPYPVQVVLTPSAVATVAGRTGDVVVSKTDVGLSAVDNTSDLSKPISTATATALSGKQDAGSFSDATITTTNITTNNVSTTKHGFAPILPNDSSLFLNGIGTYTTPEGGGSSSPAGLDKEIQFNDAGVWGHSANFTYELLNDRVVIGSSAVVLPDNPLAMTGTVDSYLQVNMQNKSLGISASSDYIATADNGDDTQNYADLGICNSLYSSTTWDVVGPNDTYVFGDGGDVTVGTLSVGKKVKVFVASTEHEAHPTDVVAEFDANGINLPTGKTFRINGVSQDLTKYNYSLTTGILTRGVISINADPTKIDITSGTSLYVDNSNPLAPVTEVLTWSQQTGLTPPSLNTAGRLWIGIQRASANTGEIVYSQEFTASEKRTIAILGRVWSNGTTTVESVGQYATPAWGIGKTLEDLMRALGSINVTGNIFSTSGANLLLDKTSGQTFRFSGGSSTDMNSANILVDSAQTAISSYHYHLAAAASGFTTLEADIDPEYYDNAGTKTAVTSLQFTIQRVFYFPKSGVIDVAYGQSQYLTLAAAESAVQTENFIISTANATSLYGSITRAWIIVQQGTTDLTNTAKCKIITATNLGAGGASSGGSSVTPASTVSTQAFGDAGTVGSELGYAREDHKHAMMSAPSSIVGITGTVAQFNTAITDGDLATGGGTATGTNTGDNAANSNYSGLASSKEDTGVAASTISTHSSTTTGIHGSGANSLIFSNDTRLTDSRPASDVSAWAKAGTKPTYTNSEVGLSNVTNVAQVDKGGDNMGGILVAQNNTSYTTAQARNITLSTSTPSGGSNGDIWIQYIA